MSDQTPNDRRRPIRSFVLRKGRLTDAQARALEELWPRFGIEEEPGELNLERLFGRTAPLVIEIGFGNGAATWRMAQAEPDKNFIGVEVHRPGVGHLLQALQTHELDNVRIACSDAVAFLENRIPRACVDEMRIYFPDPWPKKRHHKRRIIQPAFLTSLASRMRAGGLLHLATDWAPYAEHMQETLAAAADWENLSPTGDYCEQPVWRPATKYEQRGERLGHRVFDLVARRR